MIDLLDLHAAAIQAIAAICTLVLTIVLAGATVWYAKSAEEQIEELRKARTAGVEPYVRIPSMWLDIRLPEPAAGSSDRNMRTLVVEAPLKNLGPGPAIDIRIWLELPEGVQGEYEGPPHLGSGEEAKIVIRVGPPYSETLISQFPHSTVIRVWYRDLLDRWWVTSSHVVLGLARQITDREFAAGITPTAESRQRETGEPKAPRALPNV